MFLLSLFILFLLLVFDSTLWHVELLSLDLIVFGRDSFVAELHLNVAFYDTMLNQRDSYILR